MATYSLSGSGTQSLTTNTTALHVTITTVPAVSGLGRANPASRYDVGLIRFGDGTGYWSPTPVLGGPQWIGVPNGSTSFGYSLFGTAAISVVEVIGGISPFGGPPGSTGATGSAGPGVATGGTTGQVLAKNSSTNYDTGWITPSSGATLSYSRVELGADVTQNTVNTWTDALTLSLAAGTWLIEGSICIYSSSSFATDLGVRIYDGTNTLCSAMLPRGGNGTIAASNCGVQTIVVLASTTTIKLQGIGDNANGTVFRAANTFNGVGNHSTWLQAVKIA